MMKKRGRVSTEAELQQVDTTPPAAAAAAVSTPVEFVAAPEKEKESVGIPRYMGEFLKNCYYCKKLIPDKSEIYMYRDFCAFCSPECRETQMAIDGNKEMLSTQGKGNQQQKRATESKRQHI